MTEKTGLIGNLVAISHEAEPHSTAVRTIVELETADGHRMQLSGVLPSAWTIQLRNAIRSGPRTPIVLELHTR